jgi:hypothetical protein
MRDGICPKCDSREIYTDAYLRSKITVAGMNQVVAKVGVLSNTLVEYDNFYCTNCGLLERYIVRPEDRAKVLENWTRIGQE